MNFDFLNTELEPNDFEGHKKLRDIIRKSAKEAGSPHVIVGTFNTEQTNSNAIAMTSILFEILMNSLINPVYNSNILIYYHNLNFCFF